MEPEPRQPFEAQESAQPLTANPESAVGAAPPAPPEMGDGIQWVLIGPRGLRWGWSVALFCSVLFLGLAVIGALLSRIMAGAAGMMKGFTAERMALSEAVVLAAVLLAGFVVALVERRRLKDFNLGGPRGVRHFSAGLAVGYAAL